MGGKELTVALAGNPNSGKTSLFNALTGARQHVGNYPGVTVERREGQAALDGRPARVLDLPGTYSLTSYSPEERIAQDELLGGSADVVVVVVDTTNLKRSLVLLAQLMHMGANVLLCLNMADEADRSGLRLDLDRMRALLGFPVVRTAAHKGTGVAELRAAILHAAAHPVRAHRLALGEDLEKALAPVRARLVEAGVEPARLAWTAVRLLVGDETFASRIDALGTPGRAATGEAAGRRFTLERTTGIDAPMYVTERYFGFVDGLLREVVLKRARENARAVSERIDRVLAHPVLGVPLFLGITFLVFWITFRVGAAPMDWIEAGFGRLGDAVGGLWPEGAESPLRSLLVDGVIGGVGGVLVFLPNVVLLFLCLAILEDTGYMARAAFLVDRVMHRFGLHGRSFIPLMTGFGCSIPGILGTRVLESERDRIVTMLVLPLMSCGARLPIWLLLVPAFFAPEWQAPALWLIYTTGVALALLLALLLRRTILRGEDAPFVMELPPYRLPTARALAGRVMERAWLYLRKAGTVILGISIVMWAVTTWPQPESAAEKIGRAMAPALEPMGLDGRVGTAMVGAFVAKEVFVAQMGIAYAVDDAEDEEGSVRLRESLRRDYSPLAGVSLILLMLIAMPCMATFAVVRRESGSWRWAALQSAGLTGLAWVLAVAVYQAGSAMGF